MAKTRWTHIMLLIIWARDFGDMIKLLLLCFMAMSQVIDLTFAVRGDTDN